MSALVLTRTYAAPPVNEREILRYAGCRDADEDMLARMRACLAEVEGQLSYQVCWCELPAAFDGGTCNFGSFSLFSKQLAKNLAGCSSVLLFAATVGVQLDRLLLKYGRLAPSKALFLQAIGAERIEALCDVFCEDFAAGRGVRLRPRFSPGYGDLPLAAQREIFAVLECPRRIGLSLNDSLLMSPTKSVTAFAGIMQEGGDL